MPRPARPGRQPGTPKAAPTAERMYSRAERRGIFRPAPDTGPTIDNLAEKSAELHDGWRHRRTVPLGTITVAQKFRDGTLNLAVLGRVLGWEYCDGVGTDRQGHHLNAGACRVSIRNCGPILVGTAKHCVCVREGSKRVFLARSGRIWPVNGAALPEPAPPMGMLTVDERRTYADAVVRRFADQMDPLPEARMVKDSNGRYRKVVAALVNSRVLDAAANGYHMEALDFAHGVCETWDREDLLSPSYPTMQHAIYVSMVLALPRTQAAPLVETAALLEYKVPIIDRDIARAVYGRCCDLLAKLCPSWWSSGYLTNWTLVGSIDRLFRAEYARILNQAAVRDTPLGAEARTEAPVPAARDDAHLLDPETGMRTVRNQHREE